MKNKNEKTLESHILSVAKKLAKDAEDLATSDQEGITLTSEKLALLVEDPTRFSSEMKKNKDKAPYQRALILATKAMINEFAHDDLSIRGWTTEEVNAFLEHPARKALLGSARRS